MLETGEVRGDGLNRPGGVIAKEGAHQIGVKGVPGAVRHHAATNAEAEKG